MTPHEHQAIIKSQILGSYKNTENLVKKPEVEIKKDDVKVEGERIKKD